MGQKGKESINRVSKLFINYHGLEVISLKVGIDIGTSYSSIAIIGDDGVAEPVKVANEPSAFGDSYSMPSAVFVDDKGNIVIGQIAMSSKRKKPSSFKSEFKRDLGQDIPYNLGPLQLLPEDLYK